MPGVVKGAVVKHHGGLQRALVLGVSHQAGMAVPPTEGVGGEGDENVAVL